MTIIILKNINDTKPNLRVSHTVQRSLTGDFVNTDLCIICNQNQDTQRENS